MPITTRLCKCLAERYFNEFASLPGSPNRRFGAAICAPKIDVDGITAENYSARGIGIIMTTLKRAIAPLIVALAIGAGIHQAWRATSLQKRVQILQRAAANHAEQLRQSTQARDEAAHQLAGLRQEIKRLSATASEVLKLRAEVAELKGNQPTNTKANDQVEEPEPVAADPIEIPEAANLNAQQLKLLHEMSEKVITGNSVADLGRLKDSLERWDELFITPAPPEMKPVFAILKLRVQERVAELEQQ